MLCLLGLDKKALSQPNRPVDWRRVCLDGVIFWHHKTRIAVVVVVDVDGSRVTNFVVC